MFTLIFSGITIFIVTVLLTGLVAGPKWPGYVMLLVAAIVNALVAAFGLTILGIDQAPRSVQSTRMQIMFGTDALCFAGSIFLGYRSRWGVAAIAILSAVPIGLGL